MDNLIWTVFKFADSMFFTVKFEINHFSEFLVPEYYLIPFLQFLLIC